VTELSDPLTKLIDQRLVYNWDQNYTYCMQRSTDNKYRPGAGSDNALTKRDVCRR